MQAPDLIPAQLVAKRRVAESVVEFRFRGGQPFDPPSPGAHIDVLTPCGERRSYSLTAGPQGCDGDHVIAVALDRDGRGGSLSMHSATEVGTTMWISPELNTFPLLPASEYLLIAGGIGITPIRSMFHAIRACGGVPVTLVYLVRDRAAAAYVTELSHYSDSTSPLIVHATDEHGGERFDLWSVLKEPTAGRVYCCASPAVLESVRLLTAHWRSSRVHVEDFRGVDQFGEFAAPFTATWAPTGQDIDVAADTTLFDALAASGVSVPVSCRSGTCGTCRVSLLSGDVDHRDVILDEQQRRTQMTSCVSRGNTAITIGPLPVTETETPCR